MLSLAGIPATAGFIGKFYLIQALVDGDYTWLGVVIVVGSMISLGYYLRVIAAIWMRETPAPARRHRPTAARCSPAARPRPTRRRARSSRWSLVALAFAAATVFFGIVPQPLFDLANHAAASLTGLF